MWSVFKRPKSRIWIAVLFAALGVDFLIGGLRMLRGSFRGDSSVLGQEESGVG